MHHAFYVVNKKKLITIMIIFLCRKIYYNSANIAYVSVEWYALQVLVVNL